MFECEKCGNIVKKKTFQCLVCNNINSFIEKQSSVLQSDRYNIGQPKNTPKLLSNIRLDEQYKIPSNINELDRVLGDGFVQSQVILLAAKPGVGKSSLATLICKHWVENNRKVLYASGEESVKQIKTRTKRFNIQDDNENFYVCNQTNLEELLGQIQQTQPSLVIVDSLQTLTSSKVQGGIGSTTQSKECSHAITDYAKKTGIIFIIVSQVTKDGEFSGSNSVKHIVDTTLLLDTDSENKLRFLRSDKNRFGATDEVGIFTHTENGFEQVVDPTGILVENINSILPGVAFSFISQGNRKLPIEIQSLIASSSFSNPKRQFSGIDYNRGQIAVALVDKILNIDLQTSDVYVSTVNGIRASDTSVDLAIIISIVSCITGKTLPKKTCCVGEVTLTGQVRGKDNIQSIIVAASKLGFEQIIIPKQSKPLGDMGIKIVEIDNIKQVKTIFCKDKK